MKKLFVHYEDGSKIVYTMKNSTNENTYINRHINNGTVKEIILQKYPKKHNEPVVLLRKAGHA